jgi:hypothetical protein
MLPKGHLLNYITVLGSYAFSDEDNSVPLNK